MLNKRTISALPTAVPIVLEDSSAACSPRLGFPPVPANAPILLALQDAAAKALMDLRNRQLHTSGRATRTGDAVDCRYLSSSKLSCLKAC